MEMWPVILLLGAFSADFITANEVKHGNNLLNITNGILRSIKSEGDSSHLDLSGLALRGIEKHVFDSSPEMKSLNIAHNKLQYLSPLLFSKLTQLETLTLAGNKISQLQVNVFKALTKLKILNISYNSLTHLLPGAFYGLTPSVNIIAEGNNLSSISAQIFADPAIRAPKTAEVETPEYISRKPIAHTISGVLHANVTVKICKTSDGIVKSVEELQRNEALGDCAEATVNHGEINLSNLGLRKFQKGWYKLSAVPVSEINLSNNTIIELSAELVNDLPAGLIVLSLASNKIEIIKKNVIENHHLVRLILRNNSIATIEDGALENTKLFDVDLSINRLKSLSFARGLPSTIQNFIADNNEIAEVPEDSMKHLTELRYIYLSNNNITDLPVDTFRGLSKINRLFIFGNQLSDIHPGTFEDQTKLAHLHLSANRITHLKSGAFRGLKMVERIFLDSNKIRKISNGAFPELKGTRRYNVFLFYNEMETIEKGSFADASIGYLDLDSNKISAIEAGAFDTPTLRSLHLGGNALTMIDVDSLTGLPNLRVLGLARNKITSIKKGAVKNLKKLVRLDISDNPIERLENGALYGFATQDGTVLTNYTPIKLIQGGIFEDM